MASEVIYTISTSMVSKTTRSSPVPEGHESAMRSSFEVSPTEETVDLSLSSLLLILRRRFRVIASIVTVGLVAGLFLASKPKRYEAYGSLQVRSGSSNQFKLDTSSLTGGSDSDDRTESEVQILQSRSLLTAVAKKLNLASNPNFSGKAKSSNRSIDDPTVQADIIRQMHAMIRIERVPKTQIIDVYCSSTDPMLGEEIVNSLINEYIERVFKTRFSSTDRASKFMTQQLEDLRGNITKDQQKLIDFQGRLGVVGLDDSHNLVTDQLEELAKANEQADIQRIVAEARYRILQDEPPDLLDGGPAILPGSSAPAASSSLLQTLRATQATISTEYASVNEQFGPNYPEAKRLKARLLESAKEVTDEQNRVVEQAKTSYAAAVRNQTMTSAALDARKKQAFLLRNDMVNYQILLHDYQSSRTLYEGLMQRLREAGVVAGLESADIDIVDLATLPVTPTGTSGLGFILISLGIGLISGVLVALTFEALDTTVHSVEELQRFINLPALAILPSFELAFKQARGKSEMRQDSNKPGDLLEVLRSKQSHFAEGIQLLRSSLLLAKAGERPKSFIFTSSVPREGKSTVCANLACVLAMNGDSVLLIDADLRRPSQHIKFGLPNMTGLSNVLTSGALINDVTQRISAVPSLSIVTSGSIPPAPSTLLASRSMQEVIIKACEEYAFVLIDMPPALAISDAVILAELADFTVLVVRDGMVNKKTLRRLRDVLLRVGARIPGFVFNGVSRNSSEYYDYKGQYGYSDYGYLPDDAAR